MLFFKFGIFGVRVCTRSWHTAGKTPITLLWNVEFQSPKPTRKSLFLLRPLLDSFLNVLGLDFFNLPSKHCGTAWEKISCISVNCYGYYLIPTVAHGVWLSVEAGLHTWMNRCLMANYFARTWEKYECKKKHMQGFRVSLHRWCVEKAYRNKKGFYKMWDKQKTHVSGSYVQIYISSCA